MLFSIKNRLLISHITVALIAAIAASVYLLLSFTRLHASNNEHALLSSAYTLADAVETDFGTPHGNVLIKHVMAELVREERAHFAVMEINGKVISSTDPNYLHENLRPLVRLMQGGQPQIHHRTTGSPDEKRVIVDVPLERNEKVVGVVRAWILEKDYQASVSPIKRITGLALAGVMLLCIVISFLIAQALILPINKMKRLSRRIAHGDFGIRINDTGNDELGELATDLNSMASRLQDLENSRRDFLGDVSHELRSPVSNIRITSEVLERRAEKLGDDSSKLFGTVILETERLEEMINELIELAAIKSGALQLNKETFDMKTLIDELTLGIYPKAQQKQQTIEVEVNAGLFVFADRERFGRAIANLLDNAVKFTPTAGKLELVARQEPAGVLIRVSDTGEGIAKEDMPRVFERFYRADKARQRNGGAGIGLAMVKNIIEAHGGTVSVTSVEGQGCTFEIRLPAR